MATSFKREPTMKTTEPSVDEVGGGMKRGGHARKKMAMGGMPAGALAAASATRRPNPRAAMMEAAMAQRPMMRKKGGSIHNEKAELKRVRDEMKSDRKEEHNEHAEIKRVEKELKSHEHMKAGKAHHGLKRGGMARDDTPGGLLGGISATRPNPKRVTGGIEGPGYKGGGKIQRDTVASEAKTKMVTAKQRKTISSKTGGVEGRGYAKGGSVKPYENTKVVGGPKMPTVKSGTGSIKQSPAGYKAGGHVAMACSGGEGHKGMKKGGCW